MLGYGSGVLVLSSSLLIRSHHGRCQAKIPLSPLSKFAEPALTMLSDMLEGRDKISNDLQKIIDIRTEPWGINVISVEVKDVLIPAALEDAMSMQAQAERERQARVILGNSEKQVAEKFGEAAKTYVNNPVALHLRAMNMLYEGLKQNSTIVIVPSSAVETMQLGGLAGLTALTMGLGQERANQGKEGTQPGPWSEPGPAKAVVG